jgi:hypothetical protein
LKSSKEFNQELFSKLLTKPSDGKNVKLAALFHSDIELLMASLKHDFPKVVSISSIGNTFEKRNITLMTLDAREDLINHGDKLF